jgi:hypothetical protein
MKNSARATARERRVDNVTAEGGVAIRRAGRCRQRARRRRIDLTVARDTTRPSRHARQQLINRFGPIKPLATRWRINSWLAFTGLIHNAPALFTTVTF